MPLILRHSRDLPLPATYAHWFATTGSNSDLDTDCKLPNIAARLEQAYDSCRDICWRLGRALAEQPGSEFARTPTVGAYGSDLRLMLAWVHLATEIGASDDEVLGICDDPWLFRELAAIEGVMSGSFPALLPLLLLKRIRGYLSRIKLALVVTCAAVQCRAQRREYEHGTVAILVYGHPQSDADGHDAYFGELMRQVPTVKRLLHTDCTSARAAELGRDGRTASLHAWGTLHEALQLPST